MNRKSCEKNNLPSEIYAKIFEAEKQVENGKILDADFALRELRIKYKIPSQNKIK